MKTIKKILIISCIFLTSTVFAQENSKIIDEVIAIVGQEMIMLSDLENHYLQYRSSLPDITKCEVLDDLLFQKLLITQAAIDSIEVNEAYVEMELDNRIRYFISSMGSKEKFESFYGKKVDEIKNEFRESIRDQMIVETVKDNITVNTKITPTEVREYFNSIPKSEVPDIPAEYEISQIIKKPTISVTEMEVAYNKIAGIRERVINGEDFSTMAVLYSEDPGSASQGGSIGTVGRGDTYPDFEAAAYALKPGEISNVIKTQAGYHIIKSINRMGDYIDVQHILIVPKASPYDLHRANQFLDSVYNVIKNDTMSFETAARKFSDDPGKINGGIIVNPYTGNTWFDATQLGNYDAQLFFIIDKLQVGEISRPSKMMTEDGNEAYRILLLKSRTVPHKANLRDDYNKIQGWAEQEKNTLTIAKWVRSKAAKTYIFIKDEYQNCDILNKWIQK
ncbi:MAG: peptidylprolyl isomerase [Bacteroidales bacterium]|jgi:peptidyl-prolyl cis-trans isomerase SurA|nr:peptidylprolyl isomerase [Bacteroidales bacterium]